MKNGVLFCPQEIGNLFIEVKCANVLSQNDKANSFGNEKNNWWNGKQGGQTNQKLSESSSFLTV